MPDDRRGQVSSADLEVPAAHDFPGATSLNLTFSATTQARAFAEDGYGSGNYGDDTYSGSANRTSLSLTASFSTGRSSVARPSGRRGY